MMAQPLWLDMLGLAIAVPLFVYLLYTLLFPERF